MVTIRTDLVGSLRESARSERVEQTGGLVDTNVQKALETEASNIAVINAFLSGATTGTVAAPVAGIAGWTAQPTLGTTGTPGKLNIAGNTSGVITIQPQAAAGTYNLNLPVSAGGANSILQSQG